MKGSGANHYPRAPAQNDDQHLRRFEEVKFRLENSLFIMDTNETVSKSKHEEFGETYYNCQIELDIVYSKEPLIIMSQKTMEFHWKSINIGVMTEKKLLKNELI